MNIIKNRYLYFLISLIIIIPGLIYMGLNWSETKAGPLLLGIDFRGGSLLEVQFSGNRPTIEQITSMYADFSSDTERISDPVVQPLGEDAYSIRSKTMSDETKGAIVTEMENRFSSTVTVLNFTSVSASIGAEVTKAAGFAILAAAIAILGYISYAFRGVKNPHRYGAAAILAMLHDVFVVLGVEAILGYYFGWEVDALFLTALLTVIGFSVHDSIVVFDRVRENSNIYRRLDYETMVNHSIVQTLDRSINTQLTVMLTLLALVLFGGESTRHFVIILLVGILSGTYSSIFNAAPILVVWENREWETWFKQKEIV